MNLLELFLGQIPEGLFFGLFMIFVKGIKTKRKWFALYSVVEYVLLLRCFHNTLNFYVLFLVLMFVALKCFYREKAQITDVFILVIGYFYVGITSIMCYYICFNNVVMAALLNRFVLFVPLLLYNYKLYNIQRLYKKQWNRGNQDAKIKSTTFRSINLVLFYIAFVLIHIGIVFGITNYGIRR